MSKPKETSPREQAEFSASNGSARFGVWITNRDGTDGRWMSDRDNGKDVWTGSEFEAEHVAHIRRFYRWLNYEVREVREVPNNEAETQTR